MLKAVASDWNNLPSALLWSESIFCTRRKKNWELPDLKIFRNWGKKVFFASDSNLDLIFGSNLFFLSPHRKSKIVFQDFSAKLVIFIKIWPRVFLFFLHWKFNSEQLRHLETFSSGLCFFSFRDLFIFGHCKLFDAWTFTEKVIAVSYCPSLVHSYTDVLVYVNLVVVVSYFLTFTLSYSHSLILSNWHINFQSYESSFGLSYTSSSFSERADLKSIVNFL